MGNSLEAPIVDKDSDDFTSHVQVSVGASGMQGWRLEMEDAHVSVDLPSALDHLFLAVFDGHAGGGAAKYAASNIVRVLENNSDFKKYVATGCEDIKLLGDAMTRVFVDLDEEIKDHQMKSADDSSGCTAVTAIVTPKFIMCINAGDSRCVLGTNGTFKELSFDHKPYNEKERTRITDAGGFVQWNRVDGDLAVSRALGDFTYKNFNGPPEKQKVTCYPDIITHERTNSDDVLLLACDGLWDVLSSSEAIDTVREIFKSGEVKMSKVAEEMLDISLNKGSKDNISAVVVRLPACVIRLASNGGVDAIRAKRTEEQAKVAIAANPTDSNN